MRSKPISDQKSGHCFQGPLFSCEATLDKTQNVPHSFLPNYTITRLISIVSKPIVFVFVFVYSTLLNSSQIYSTLLKVTQLYSTLRNSTQLYSALPSSTQLYSTIPNSTQLNLTLPNSTQLYSTLLNSTQLYSTLPTSIQLYSTRYALKPWSWALRAHDQRFAKRLLNLRAGFNL